MLEATGDVIFVYDHVNAAKAHANDTNHLTSRSRNGVDHLFKRTGELRDAAAGQGQVRTGSKEKQQSEEEKKTYGTLCSS